YAPTFREGSVDGKRIVFSEIWTMDFARLLKNLTVRFGGEWYLCLRMHPQLAAGFKGYENEALKGRLIDESQRDDMSEILAAMDVCITDYSSVAVDASYAHMPVFLYADDIEKYMKDRGGMQWNMSLDSKAVVKNNKDMTPSIDTEMPYSVAQNNDELEENILMFNEEEYQRKLEKFEKDVKLVFDGKASQSDRR
ncbi:MAG: CDP-glycerol glycerophosphotransferase family protein, partial [Clostridia bacterium]|nr:CDP-glycerol glycerophosphotransferase family protein [Clostridia bacterium]